MLKFENGLAYFVAASMPKKGLCRLGKHSTLFKEGKKNIYTTQKHSSFFVAALMAIKING
jgi:hypothetical protein